MQQNFIIRQATVGDIPALHEIRISVNENKLSDPSLVKAEDYKLFMEEKGRGWLVEKEGIILGFGIIDLHGRNVWALFIKPGNEGRGFGKNLQAKMLEWYFDQTQEMVWLSTWPGTRAEKFYRASGWTENGTYGKGEIKFEMTYDQWKRSIE